MRPVWPAVARLVISQLRAGTTQRDGQGLAASAGGVEVATFTQTGGAEGEAPVDAEADLFDQRTMVACATCCGSSATASVSIGNSSHRSGTPPSAPHMRATASQRSCGNHAATAW